MRAVKPPLKPSTPEQQQSIENNLINVNDVPRINIVIHKTKEEEEAENMKKDPEEVKFILNS